MSMTLREWRKARGWSLIQLGEALGMRGTRPQNIEPTISHWECGLRFPDPMALEVIRRLTGGEVTADAMLDTFLGAAQRRVAAGRPGIGRRAAATESE